MSKFAFNRDDSKGGVIGPRQGTDRENMNEVARGTKPLALTSTRGIGPEQAPEGVKMTPISPYKKDKGKFLAHTEENTYRAKAAVRAIKGKGLKSESADARLGIALGYHNDDIRAYLNKTYPKEPSKQDE